MATYIVGDVHGCYVELQQLLELISYHPQRDRLGFTGDLVNRGPDSLAVLRFISNLSKCFVVLGNHDLYLLAMGYGIIKNKEFPSLEPLLKAKDKFDLLEWLRQQPLLIHLEDAQTLLVHAGLPPQWSLAELLSKAQWAHQQLSGPNHLKFLQSIEGDLPACWGPNLREEEQIRYIVNGFTRMRFCASDGTLELTSKQTQSIDPSRFRPWFEWYSLPHQVFFGHWSALEGRSHNRCHALDTGCVWGGFLTAYRLEDGQRFKVAAHR